MKLQCYVSVVNPHFLQFQWVRGISSDMCLVMSWCCTLVKEVVLGRYIVPWETTLITAALHALTMEEQLLSICVDLSADFLPTTSITLLYSIGWVQFECRLISILIAVPVVVVLSLYDL